MHGQQELKISIISTCENKTAKNKKNNDKEKSAKEIFDDLLTKCTTKSSFDSPRIATGGSEYRLQINDVTSKAALTFSFKSITNETDIFIVLFSQTQEIKKTCPNIDKYMVSIQNTLTRENPCVFLFVGLHPQNKTSTISDEDAENYIIEKFDNNERVFYAPCAQYEESEVIFLLQNAIRQLTELQQQSQLTSDNTEEKSCCCRIL